MPSASDDQQPTPHKPSRYRTIRGKNVPESRRYVEPVNTPSAALSPNPSLKSGPDRSPRPSADPGPTSGQGPLPPSISNGSSVSSTSEYPSRYVLRRVSPATSSVPVSHGREALPMPSQASSRMDDKPTSYENRSDDAVQPAGPAPPPQIPLLEAAAARARHRPQPLSVKVLSPPAGPAPLPTPILVPLPSARARGVLAAEQNEGPLSPDEVAQRDEMAERLLAEQKRKDLERLERELANHQAAAANMPPKSPAREKFSFLTRRRGQSSAAPPVSPALLHKESPPTEQVPSPPPPPLPYSPLLTSPALASSSTSTPASASAAVFPSAVARPATSYTSSRAHGGPESPLPTLSSATRPPMDGPPASSAPGSAASRQVTVRCRQFSASIPITGETTVGEVLDAAVGLLPSSITPANAALAESYSRLGLERRLRRYERIRDIMNSWDNDSDNAFVIMPPCVDSGATQPAGGMSPASGDKYGLPGKSRSRDDDGHGTTTSTSNGIGRNGHDIDLDLLSVSRNKASPPEGFIFMQMHHSQKPGRWSKRYITLVQETGQIVASKKADESRLASLPADGSNLASSHSDFQNLCHLSDYDIYTPTDNHMNKHLRPPKTFCFAIKSQQRTNVFLNTENYVHFFSTDDPVEARTFYDRVFAWRSWYLVNRKLALPVRSVTNKKKQDKLQHSPMLPSSSDAGLQHVPSRRIPINPLVHHARQPTVESLFSGIGNFDPTLDLDRLDQQPPVSETATGAMRKDGEPSAFASGGLLGSAYDDRKKAELAKQHDLATNISSTVTSRDGAFAGGGPTLLGHGAASSDAHTRPHHHQASSGSFKGAESATAAGASANGATASSTWFPSASEHSARQRSKTVRETPTSSRPQSRDDIPLGIQFPQLLQQKQSQQQQQQQPTLQSQPGMGRSKSMRYASPGSRQQQQQQQNQQYPPPMPPHMPAPLIDLTPKFQEAPQWSKEGKGHGVRAPAGTAHLVDLATQRPSHPNGRSNSLVGPEPPSNSSLLRREDPYPPSSFQISSSQSTRSRTMTSSSAAVAASLSRSRSLAQPRAPRHGEAPPVPLLSRAPTNTTYHAEGGQRWDAGMTRYQ